MRRSTLVLGSLVVLVAVFHPCLSAGAEESAGSLQDVLTLQDQARLAQVVRSAEPYKSLENAYNVARGVYALGVTDSTRKMVENACKFAMATEPKTLEEIFYVSSIERFFSSICEVKKTTAQKKIILQSLEGTPDTKTLFYAVTSMSNFGMSIDKDTVPTSLVEAVENEDTPQSYAYAFQTAAQIPEADLSALFENIEDIVAQADETSSTLYFEGGLAVTSDIVTGIFALAQRVNSKPTITEAQATKFGNFIVTSKYTSSPQDAVYLLAAARALSSNKFVVPVGLTLKNTQPISKANPDLSVGLTNMMGGVVEGFTVKAKSLEDPAGEINPRSRTLTAGTDKITFSYPLFKDTTGPGLYKVIISTDTKEPSPVVKIAAMELSVVVSFQAAVGTAQLSIVDKDQGVTTKSSSLEYPNTSKAALQADQHSKVVMVFTVINRETSAPVNVHQAFIRLTLEDQEIFYVATPNSDKQYSFELDVADSAKDFGQLSGTYSLSLLVGDFALENPFTWDVASVELKFPGTPAPKEENLTYKPKPLIEHMFRVPEKRPPRTVSTTFTVLVLVPLGLIVIIWLVMGANFSNILNGGIWSFLFHTGLAAILGLYYCFWLQLNMFSTLKYLAVLGLFTFFTGNRMLRNMAKARQSQ